MSGALISPAARKAMIGTVTFVMGCGITVLAVLAYMGVNVFA